MKEEDVELCAASVSVADWMGWRQNETRIGNEEEQLAEHCGGLLFTIHYPLSTSHYLLD